MKKHLHSFFDEADKLLCEQMPSAAFLGDTVEELPQSVASLKPLYEPNERFRFLHECAIIEFKGTLYTSLKAQ